MTKSEKQQLASDILNTVSNYYGVTISELKGKCRKRKIVKPRQVIAAGRSEYIPLVENNTAENRSKNRRNRVVIMPKIDEFYEMIEKEMKNPSK